MSSSSRNSMGRPYAYSSSETEHRSFEAWAKMNYISDAFDSERLLSLVRAGTRVLDLGCAGGLITLELAARGATIVGIELSRARVEQARLAAAARSLDGVATFLEADFTAPLASLDPFDLVVAIRSLTCVVERETLHTTLSAMWNHLRPGGHLYIADFYYDPDNSAYAARYQQGVENGLHVGSFDAVAHDGSRFVAHHFDDAQIDAIARPYSIVELRFAPGHSLNGNDCTMFELVARKAPEAATSLGSRAR